MPANLGCLGCLLTPLVVIGFFWLSAALGYVDHHRSEAGAALALAGVVVGALFLGRRQLRRRAAARAEAQVLEAGARAVDEKRRQFAADDEALRVRRHQLVERFGEEEADRILARTLWVGAPAEAVQEMFGTPSQVAETVNATKVRRVLKYFPEARGRFGLKIVVEDGLVSGWEMGTP